MKGTWRGNAMRRRLPQGRRMLEHRRVGPVVSEIVRPLIGISSYARGGERPSFSVPCEYVDAIRLAGRRADRPAAGARAGARGARRRSRAHPPGGGDIDPEHYGGDDHEANYGICHERDGFELALARAALERDLPVLCVCRGMQLLNVALGGDLISHIPDVFGDAGRPPHARRAGDPAHRVGSRRRAISRASSARRRRPCSRSTTRRSADSATGLRAVAWAPDGVSRRSSRSGTRSSSPCSGIPSSTRSATSTAGACSTSWWREATRPRRADQRLGFTRRSPPPDGSQLQPNPRRTTGESSEARPSGARPSGCASPSAAS